MALKYLAAAIAFAGAMGLLAGSAGAAAKKKTVYANRDRTVIVSRDEKGRTHTRIIIQKRSFLDPGTEPLPSERSTLDYIDTPTQHAGSVLDDTAFGDRGGSALPGPFTLPSNRNPWFDF